MANTEYIMTPDGLKMLKDLDPVELKKGHFKVVIDEDGDKIEMEGDVENKNDKFHYRYKQIEDSIKEKAKDKLREEIKVKDSIEREKKLKEVIKSSTMNKSESNNVSEDETPNGSHLFSPALIF
jgi:polyribonucleotide nucleotidyltransferase